MSEKYLPDFGGKVVFVQLTLAGQWYTLFGPTFERQAGKLFLVGRTIPEDNTWARDALIHIPMDQVSSYAVFDSLETYRSRPGTQTSPPPPVEIEKRRGWFGRRHDG
jgi:hypothetical protein